MHPANPYDNKPPDFARLAQQYPSFKPFVTTHGHGHSAIDFKDPAALRELTRLLLLRDFHLSVSLPTTRLCPTLPNRLDYLLHLLDLVPYISPEIDEQTGKELRVLDIGTGATAIYPILLCRLREEARVTATDIDVESLDHARRTIEANSLEEVEEGQTGRIKLLRAHEGEILFPLRAADAKVSPYTFTICNPPFYGSEAEMMASTGLKALPAHAAPTASSNELLTPGGELAFISRMMSESAQQGMRDRCAWFTSLVGKAGSLAGLVARLGELKIDNYFVMSIRQAQTSRWIIGWSFGDARLPDTLTRRTLPSISKHLPGPNHFEYHVPTDGALNSRTAVLQALAEAGLPSTSIAAQHIRPLKGITASMTLTRASSGGKMEEGSTDEHCDTKWDLSWILSPTAVTWSRSARRQARRGLDSAAVNDAASAIFVCCLTLAEVHARPPDRSTSPTRRRSDSEMPDSLSQQHFEVKLDWLRGRDRALVEGFWSFLTRKIQGGQKESATVRRG